MNKSATILIGIILVIGGIFLLSGGTEVSAPTVEGEPAAPAANPNSAPTPTPISSPTPTPAPKAGEYTLADVSKHANSSSCWSAVNGSVYDLTAWISSHPGGEQAIKSICGKDGSAAFNGQHGGMQKQESQLAKFKIGVLVN